MAIDMEVDTSGWSVLPNTNSFRIFSVYSNVSLIGYAECI